MTTYQQLSLNPKQPPDDLLEPHNDSSHYAQAQEEQTQPKTSSTSPLGPVSKRKNGASAPGKIWRTGVFRNVPWVGIIALLLSLCSLIASAIVLVVSDGDATSSWRAAPSVIFAILSALSTACLNAALGSGLNISWWRHLLKGAPLTDAHRFWDHRNNLWAAITAGSQFSSVAAAAIFVTVAAIENPLLQRASTIHTRQVPQPVTLNVAMAVNLPSGYTADVTGHSIYPTNPSPAFSGVYKGYSNRDAITSGIDGCRNTCSTSLPGVGFKVDCLPDNITTWTWKEYDDAGTAGFAMTQFYTRTEWWLRT